MGKEVKSILLTVVSGKKLPTIFSP